MAGSGVYCHGHRPDRHSSPSPPSSDLPGRGGWRRGQGGEVATYQQGPGADPAQWDYSAIDQARMWMDAAAALQSTGPYQVMAAIQLTHARRGFDGSTDWDAILRLYDVLMAMRPGPMVQLNRAMALAKVEGPEAGLASLEAVDAGRLVNARPWHVAHGELLAASGRKPEAREELEQALALDPPNAERRLLERKLAAL